MRILPKRCAASDELLTSGDMPGPPENRFNMYIDLSLKRRLKLAAQAADQSMAAYAKQAVEEKLARERKLWLRPPSTS